MADKKTVEILFKLVDKASVEAKKIASALKDIGTTSEKTATASDKTASSLDKVGKSGTTASKGLDKTKKSSDAATKGLDKTAKSADKTAKELNDIGGKGAGSLSKFNAALNATDTSVSSIGIAVGALGVALGAPFVSAVGKSKEFQQSMATVQAVSGATTSEFKDMNEVAKELGKTTRFTASEAADGFRFLSMAGLDAAQSMEAIPSVLQLAQAGAMDLGRAADITTNILTGYGLAASELAHVNDVLVTGFTSSNSTLEELGTAFTYVGPIAKGVGANFEELVGTLGSLHNAGIKGSMAGTTLRSTLDALYNPTKQEADLMAELSERIGGVGLQIQDSEGNFVGFTSIVGQLEKSGIKAEEALKLFGQRAGPGMVALLQQGSTSLAAFDEKMKDVDGTAERIAKTMDDTFEGSLKKLGSAFDGLLIAIGDKFLPVLTKLVDGLTWVVSSVQDIHDALGPFATVIDFTIATVAALAVAAAGLGAAWGLVGAPLMALMVVVAEAGGVFALMSGAVAAVGAAFSTAAVGVIAFFTALGPIGWLIVGVTAAVTGAVAAYKIFSEDLNATAKEADKQAKAMDKLGDSIEAHEKKIAGTKEGTEAYKKETLSLRKELTETAKKFPELSNAALQAAKSIDKTTGAIEDGGAAIKGFKQLALYSEYQKIAEKGEALNKQLDELGDDKSFAELKKDAEAFGDEYGNLTEDQQELIDQLFKVEEEADAVLAKMLETGKLDVYSSTAEDVAEVADSMGIVGEESERMQEAVEEAFKDMKKSVIKEADKTVDALLDMTDPKNIKTEPMVSAFQKGMDEIADYQIDKNGDMTDNNKYFGDQTVQQYQDIYKSLSDEQAKSFDGIFAAHERQAKDIYNSSKSAADKELALAESKRQFLVRIEESIAKDVAQQKVDGFEENLDTLEHYSGLELQQLEQNTTERIAAAKLAGDDISAIQKEAAEEQAKIIADKHVKNLALAEDYLANVIVAYGKESKEAETASKKVQQYSKELSDYKINEMKRRTSALQSSLDDSLSKEKAYSAKIEELTNKIADVKTSTEDKVRGIRQRSLSDAQLQADLEAQANEKITASKRALADGDYDRAEALAKQSQDIFAGLENEGKAISGVEDAGRLLTSMYEEQKVAQEKALKAQQEISKNLATSLKSVSQSVQELVSELQLLRGVDIPITADTSGAISNVDALMAKANAAKGQFEKGSKIEVDTADAKQKLQEAADKAEALRIHNSEPWGMKIEVDGVMKDVDRLGRIIDETRQDASAPTQMEVGTENASQQIGSLQSGFDLFKNNASEATPLKIEDGQTITSLSQLMSLTDQLKERASEPTLMSMDTSQTITSVDQLKQLTDSFKTAAIQPAVMSMDTTGVEAGVTNITTKFGEFKLAAETQPTLSVNDQATQPISTLKTQVTDYYNQFNVPPPPLVVDVLAAGEAVDSIVQKTTDFFTQAGMGGALNVLTETAVASIDGLKGAATGLYTYLTAGTSANVRGEQATGALMTMKTAATDFFTYLTTGTSLNVDTTQAQTDIDGIKVQIPEIGAEPFPIVADPTEADTTITTLQEFGEKIINIFSDTTQADAEITSLEQPGQKDINVRADASAAESTISQLERPTQSTHTINVVKKVTTVEGNATGGLAGAQTLAVSKLAEGGKAPADMSGGSKLPGYGMRDVVPALLTWGERVLNSKTTKVLDQTYPGMMERVNSAKSASSLKSIFENHVGTKKMALGGLLKFQTGGVAPSVSAVETADAGVNTGVSLSMPVNVSATGQNSEDLEKSFRTVIIPAIKDAVINNTGSLTTVLKRQM